MLDAVTLDQLRMLVAIAETGSFSAAARRVGRAQSAVSHAVATLEGQLDVVLFDRTEKKPRLTPIGEAVLADARLTLARMEALKARARGLAQGLEAEVGVAVTVLCPMRPLLAVLERFAREFPKVGLELFVEEIGGSAILVHERVCGIGIAGTPSLRMVKAGDLVARPMGRIEIVSVARPDHPLAQLDIEPSDLTLNEHRQLVPTSRARQPYPNTLAREVWRVADLHTRREMILSGLGWGTVPLTLVEDDLAAGRLVRLNIPTRPDELMHVDLFAIHRSDTAIGLAGQWLLKQFEEMLPPETSRPEGLSAA